MTASRFVRTWLLVSLVPASFACGAGSAADDTRASTSALWIPGVPDPTGCLLAQPKDSLLAELVKNSWIASYPLTRLSVDANGLITGSAMPDLVAGEVALINTVPAARASVARALNGVSGLPDYGMQGMALELPSCLAVNAWTPTGSSMVPTTFQQVFAGGANINSWRVAHRNFAAECPLVRTLLNGDGVDPPGDGSTNDPASETVSAWGVRANAYGLCPAGSDAGTFCKLSYASGVNWTGRACYSYYGNLRCLVY